MGDAGQSQLKKAARGYPRFYRLENGFIAGYQALSKPFSGYFDFKI